MCPKGDDPLTPFTDYRTIALTTSVDSGVLSGYMKLTFQGFSFSFPANANDWPYYDCEASFASLPNVDEVKCSREIVSAAGTAIYTIQFRKFSVIPYENNIVYHEGNPSKFAFLCDTTTASGATSITCEISDVYNTKVPGVCMYLIFFRIICCLIFCCLLFCLFMLL